MGCINIDGYLHYFDRALLITWLLKDFGWMTTNICLGFPFGCISVLLHLFLLFFDNRRSYRYYNLSLLLWVIGNFIWMSIEFISTTPSSRIHIGPPVPIGGMSEAAQNTLINVKTFLFLIGTLIQLIMYIGIFFNWIKIPEEENEDLVSRNEAYLFCYGSKSYELTAQQQIFQETQRHALTIDHNDIDDINDIQFNFVTGIQNTLTLAYIENAYIIFWTSKDLFWSWGTGDLTKGQDLAIMYEAFAMSFGLLSIFIYILTAYLYRRNLLRFFDSITTIFWISANYVWMCGEFFIRYDNLQYDDYDAGNDSITRIISAIFFCLGLMIQFGICGYFAYQQYQKMSAASTTTAIKSSGDTAMPTMTAAYNPLNSRRSNSFEMVNLGKSASFRYDRFLVSYSPQEGHHHAIDEHHQIDGIDEETVIVF